MTRSEFLRDLADRLMHVPPMYGVDQSDADQLSIMATELANEGVGQKPSPFHDDDLEDLLG